MSKVRCPSCGFKGDVRGTEEFFEIRGQHPTSRMPVRKCRNCGAGFEVKPRFLVLFFWPKARPIPRDFWRLMEAEWERFEESETGGGELRESEDAWVTPDASRRPLQKLAEAEEKVRRQQEERE